MRLLALPLLLALTAASAPDPKTDPARLSEAVKILASPEFEGRGPATPGEEKTVAWLVDRFKALGIEPGGENGTYVQRVPMVHTKLGAGKVSLGSAVVSQGKEINLTTVKPTQRIAIEDAPMVFVGYGVSSPEGWDDFKGVDLKGKVAVFLVNDPDFESQAGEDAHDRFGGKRMTYYGRWTYKFDEAARRGAAAALIVHDTGGAGYGWSTVNANNGENYDIVRAAGDAKIPLQGWIGHDEADALFARAGLDLAKLRVEARSIGFQPVVLGEERFSADIPVWFERVETRNVLAKLTGAKRPAETVMFGAHWDAYGKAADGTVRPGANDDALGVAGVLELARLFKAEAKAGRRPDRTLVFALWTGEERGLLGSEYYGSHPLYPLETTAANLTLDILNTAGKSKNVVLVGKGASTLEDDLAAAAALQGRTVVAETFSERGLFFRADHFPVARRGVPALLLMQLGGPPDLAQGGLAAGQAWLDGYMKCYHQACDAWDANWDFTAPAQDVDLFHTMGTKIANSKTWPEWRPAFEFAAVRAKSKAARR